MTPEYYFITVAGHGFSLENRDEGNHTYCITVHLTPEQEAQLRLGGYANCTALISETREHVGRVTP